jgi:putative restriction endonuclease
MKPVKNWTDIKQNLLVLDAYRTSSDKRAREFFHDTIRNGKCYVRCEIAGRTLFGPSRFIGYRQNEKDKHIADTQKHGGETNHAIQRILDRQFQHSAKQDAELLSFCRKHKIAPKENPRKYIYHEDNIEPDDVDVLHRDIEDILGDKTLNATERERLCTARIGQGAFRRRVERLWKRCPITLCRLSSLLRASHIKPWRSCSNVERLDGFNGLLLAPHVDAAFDRGLIGFDEKGTLIFSSRLPATEARRLGLVRGARVRFLPHHQRYLEYHRKQVFHP